MKKSILSLTAIIALLLTVCLCACSDAQNDKKVSMFDLKNAMAGASNSFSDMTYASSADPDPAGIFANISDMDYSKVDSFFIYYATDGNGNADEIAVIQVKDKRDLSLAKSELEEHVKKRIALYSTYDKSQLDKLGSAVIETDGNCAALIVGDDAAKIATAFHAFFDGE